MHTAFGDHRILTESGLFSKFLGGECCGLEPDIVASGFFAAQINTDIRADRLRRLSAVSSQSEFTTIDSTSKLRSTVAK